MCPVKKTHQIVSMESKIRVEAAAGHTEITRTPADQPATVRGYEQLVRIGELRRLFGITRPTAYLLAKEGKIQTVSLRKFDQLRGARMVSLPSVRAYLRELEKEYFNSPQP